MRIHKQRSISSKFAGAILFSLMCTSQNAFALVHVEAAVGSKSGSWKQSSTTESLNATTLRAAIHLDPIPLVPIGFGVSVLSDTWSNKKAELGLGNLSSYSLIPEVTAWLPLGSVMPRARLGYSVLTAYSADMELTINGTARKGAIRFAGQGLHAALGVEWSLPFVPGLSLIADYAYSDEKLTLATKEVASVDVSSVFKDTKVTTTSIQVGAKFGF